MGRSNPALFAVCLSIPVTSLGPSHGNAVMASRYGGEIAMSIGNGGTIAAVTHVESRQNE
jgi:hypothetical protein